jgi:hypothetical protein
MEKGKVVIYPLHDSLSTKVLEKLPKIILLNQVVMLDLLKSPFSLDLAGLKSLGIGIEKIGG